jgi:hypothetical protein
MDLAHADVIVESVGMTRLVVARRSPSSAFGEDLLDPVEVTVEPIDPLTSYLEPCPTVDPWSPLPEICHSIPRVALV